MSFIREISQTVTLTTLGAYAGVPYSADVGNGEIVDVYVSISKAIGASGKVTITTTSTDKMILTVADPSTLGQVFYPVQKPHGTTANVLGTSAVPWRILTPMANERLRIKVASSSGLAARTVTVKARLK
jgi:hypothetical protein